MENLLYEDLHVTRGSAPVYSLNNERIDIWQHPFIEFHSKTPVDYVQKRILTSEKEGIDVFADVVGKEQEKNLVKNALLSGSPILFKGKRGYGKTTFSKAIAKLLPEKQLAIKDCKIYDDPTHPTCFSCKRKILENNVVELIWIPRMWVRIPGDPMLTTRQLVGGISIQKIREGYDLDHPEVFIPGRALKSNRGVGYFDELGAVPSSLQTLLHELFEEKQVTTLEGDIVPFKINTLEVASTNPANYRGTNPIKEPLLDRMEEIEIGPPENLEEEIEIGLRNMYVVKVMHQQPEMPYWHLKILGRTVRYARNKDKREITRRIESEPSCRATIKIYDHVKSRALRSGREVVLLSDYGGRNEIVKLGLLGRIEVEYGATDSKDEIVDRLLAEAVKTTCKEIYDIIPTESFTELYNELYEVADEGQGARFFSIDPALVPKLKDRPNIQKAIAALAPKADVNDEWWLSTVEIILHAVSLCIPRLVERSGNGYMMHEWKKE